MVVSGMRRPSVLYRYRAINRDYRAGDVLDRLQQELRAIIESYVWCSNYQQMNDPMEGYYWAEFSEMRYNDAVRYFKKEKLDLGIACFSETHDNDLMWAHYARNFSGICIEYQYDMLSEKFGKDETAILAPIDYSNTLATITDDDLSNGLEALRRILLQKKESWAYEKEWRLLASRGKQTILPGTISKIYCGSRIEDYDREELMRAVAAQFPDVEFQQMEVKGYSYRWVAA